MKAAKLRRLGVVMGVLVTALACGNKVAPGDPGPGGGGAGSLFVESVSTRSEAKIDLLFMVDNSISMADKQAILKDAIPDLVRRFVAPNCVNADGEAGATPGDPTEDCPAGYQREFIPVRDMHVGVITSSLGGHGATVCDGVVASVRNEEENDHGHLIASRPRFASELAKAPGAQMPHETGFLDWNPNSPNGSVSAFTSTFQTMVTAAGEFGCGYESQLEAIYRFLVDPAPFERLELSPCSPTNSNPCAYPQGVDVTLLNQRRAFLRPDSLVGVVLISDENDCSIVHKQQGYYVARADDLDLPRSTAACATNPNSPCCVSCISGTPAGCSPDPACSAGGGAIADELDPPNLRCFNQKKRFGIDFLYPTNRYVNALRAPELCTSNDDLSFNPGNRQTCKDDNGDGKPDISPNPLFEDLTSSGALPRAPESVFLAGIVGVPWQDLQAESRESGTAYPANELHFKSASQLQASNVWEKILGAPKPPGGGAPIAPTNALMNESVQQRGGNDGQGIPLAPPGSRSLANPVNSHEWGNTRQDDLQYACIFRLPEPRDCTAVPARSDLKPACDCEELRDGDDNPLCQNSTSHQYEQTQYFAKAYPGLRELQVLKDFGSNAIVASICARNLSDASAQDYGYRPAMAAIVDRVSEGFTPPCLYSALDVDPETGEIPCSIVEVRPRGTVCEKARRRVPTDQKTVDSVRDAMAARGLCGGAGLPPCDEPSMCTLLEAGIDCHRAGPPSEPGWCYIDPSQNPQDDPSLVSKCRSGQEQILRFVDPDHRTPEPDAAVFIACRVGSN